MDAVGQWTGFLKNNDANYELTINVDPYRNSVQFSTISLFDPTLRRYSLLFTPIKPITIADNQIVIHGNCDNVWNRDDITAIPAVDARRLVISHQIHESIELSGTIINKNKITGTWRSNIEEGTFEAKRTIVHKSSRIRGEVLHWNEFKERYHGGEGSHKIFRGQSNNWPIRSSFHRTNRNDLALYSRIDVQKFHRHVSGITGRKYNLIDPLEHMALLYLGQHYGFPTPLIDWTSSPYIGAFFAFLNVPKHANKGHARIFIFDSQSWNLEQYKATEIGFPKLTLTFLEPLGMGNERMLPQQSVCMFSNVNDVERLLLKAEKDKAKTYISAIDIPYTERNLVLQDLKTMGLSAATLFPGIEGVCKALSEDLF